MKEAAEFLVDFLVEHPKTGKLVTGPSMSPENVFFSPDGRWLAACNEEGELHLWHAPSWEEIEAAEKGLSEQLH